jgi:hypothetical protein
MAVALMTAVIPDIVIAVAENVLEERLFHKLEQSDFRETKLTYQKILHYFKHRSVANFVVNDHISLRNMPNISGEMEAREDSAAADEPIERTEIDD